MEQCTCGKTLGGCDCRNYKPINEDEAIKPMADYMHPYIRKVCEDAKRLFPGKDGDQNGYLVAALKARPLVEALEKIEKETTEALNGKLVNTEHLGDMALYNSKWTATEALNNYTKA